MSVESIVERQLSAIHQSAERMDAAAPAVIGTASPGDVVRQGDLYLVCLEDEPPGEQAGDFQLAPGTSQGSRHVAEGDCQVIDPDAAGMAREINRLVKGAAVPAELAGPVVVCRGETTITHPEHGNRTLPAETAWATVYQPQYGEQVRRVQD